MSSPVLELRFGRYRDLVGPVARRIHDARAKRITAGGMAALLREPVEVVVASRAAAEAIAAALVALTGGPVAGVEMRTLDRFAASVLHRAGEYPRVASDAEQRLAMAGAAAVARQPLQAVEGLAPLLLRSWRDLRDADRTLADFARESARGADRDLGAALASAWRRFEGAIQKIGAVDPADLFVSAARALDGGAAEVPSQIVFGFYDATAVQERLLFALHRAGALDSIWIPIPRPGGAVPDEYRFAKRFVDSIERLGRLGEGHIFPFSQKKEDVTLPEDAPFDIARAASQIDEIRDAVAKAGALIDEGVRPGHIAIVARSMDDRLAAVVRQAASELGVPAVPRRGRPFVSHPFARAVRDLLRVRRERFHRELVVELASVPWRRGILPERVTAADLDETARRAELAAGTSASIRRILPESDEHLRERLSTYAEAVAALEGLSGGTEQPKRGAAWAGWLVDLTQKFRVDSDTDLAALERLVDIAETLRRIDPAGSAIPPERLVGLLEAAPDLEDAPAGGERVWVGDLMSFRGRSFRHVFAVAMQQEIFPQRRSEDLLFSNRERRRLGVREIDDGNLEERLLFRILRDGATERIHFSYAAADASGRAFRPSMFLKRLALESVTAAEERKEIVGSFDAWVERHAAPFRRRRPLAAIRADAVAAANALPERLHRQIRLGVRSGTRSEFDGFVEIDDALRGILAGRLAALSPGRLQTFGECPQRFFLQTVLGIGEVEEPEIELEITARKKGTLEHEILERFYRELPEDEIARAQDTPALEPHLRARLEEIVAEAFEEYERRYPAPSPLLRRVERRLALRNLEEFLAGDLAELAATGLRPWKFELMFGIGREDAPPEILPVPLPVEGHDVRLRGRIDRVDRGPDDRLRIVDYKRGKGNFYKGLGEKIRRGHALQLALYALAAARIFDVPPEKVDAAIKPIASREKGDRFSFALSEYHDDVAATLGVFARAILAGRFPAITGDPRADHCRWCAVANWCRTRHTPEEAWASRRFESALRMLETIETEAQP
ncbi:MAG: PD-(D/E)XK nuclease family protein [Thermoanaerobaculia bacterium]